MLDENAKEAEEEVEMENLKGFDKQLERAARPGFVRIWVPSQPSPKDL